MQQFLRSPWFPVSFLITGLILGYTVVVAQHDVSVAEICPAPEVCQGEDCDRQHT